MGGASGWRTATSVEDWMRNVEKRLMHEERRPNIRTAADLLGPGVAPYSIWINDWNTDETAFNGFFHSEPGALHSPNNTRYWMGSSQATRDGYGLQRVSEYRGDPTEALWPRPTYVRKFFTISGQQRQFSTWRLEDGTPVGMISEFGGSPAGTAPNSWLVCNGTTVLIEDYPDLYAVIATRYNTTGEPAGTFRLPNIAGKVIRA